MTDRIELIACKNVSQHYLWPSGPNDMWHVILCSCAFEYFYLISFILGILW